MNKSVMAAVFALGLAALVWTGWGFAGSSPLALAMTIVMAAVYLWGALELWQFRGATVSLLAALPGAGQPEAVDALQPWLGRLHPSLRPAVQQRVVDGRAALPGPVVTPYLVGLLVMLGMLGTFLGMVVTFRGAVFALETSASLDAMRAALAEPIKGLGLAFGTSVAGVASSAMLGLLSTLVRRERLAAVRHLDAHIATTLRRFSAGHQQDETLAALQAQARALPVVADRLHALAEGLESRHDALSRQLAAQQDSFHREAATAYSTLAQAVGVALEGSLTASARAAGDALRPVVERAMADLADESRRAHERLDAATQRQMQALAGQWEGTARVVSDTWTEALHRQDAAQGAMVQRLGAALDHGVQGFEQRSQALLAALHESAAHTQAAQTAADAQRQEAWRAHMAALAAEGAAQWEAAGARAAQQLEGVCEALGAAVAGVVERLEEQAQRSAHGAAQVLERADALLRTREEAEGHWVRGQGERMDAVAAVWRSELGALRDAEAARAQAAVDRLSTLQAAVAQHLAELGTALEAPLSRLLQTATQVPKAAAEMMARLRTEMAQLGERENLALAEREAITQLLHALLQSVNAAAAQQQAAIQSAVGAAASALEEAADRHGHAMEAHSGKADAAAVQVAAGAVELASLGEAFGHGVALFTASNDRLLESLQRIEGGIGQSLSRSDEQLAYYVAQAREVIDLSITSQQGIVEDLRRLHGAAAEGARAPALEAAT